MGADSPHRAFTYPPDPWLTLSLAVATLMTAWPPRSDGGFSFFLPLVLLVASLRFRVVPLALIGLFVIGVELRGLEFGAGLSDVPETIRLALGDMLRGGNPYAPVFDPAFPLQQPFPYGPLALLWYLPFRDPRLVELGVSVALLAVLAVRGRPLGLALWATVPVLVHLASDGSNDHTAALIVLVALVVLERSPRAGALLVGVAAGFKIYALAWLPPIFVWAGAGALATGILGFVLVWLPAAVAWGAGNVLDTFRAADSIHTTPYFSLSVKSSTASGSTRHAIY